MLISEDWPVLVHKQISVITGVKVKDVVCKPGFICFIYIKLPLGLCLFSNRVSGSQTEQTWCVSQKGFAHILDDKSLVLKTYKRHLIRPLSTLDIKIKEIHEQTSVGNGKIRIYSQVKWLCSRQIGIYWIFVSSEQFWWKHESGVEAICPIFGKMLLFYKQTEVADSGT